MYNRNTKRLQKTAYQVCPFSLKIFIVRDERSFDRAHFSERGHGTWLAVILRTRLRKIYSNDKQYRGSYSKE
jgi:hypothetical protein